MSMVCPQCNQTFEKNLDCPSCGCRLQYHLAAYRIDAASPTDREESWQQKPWGRIVVGLLLAQGLAYGARHLFTAGFLASADANTTLWATTLWGLILLQALQGLSLMIGACLTGAGQHQGMLYGGFIGLLHGLIFYFVQKQNGEVQTPVAVYCQPILYAAFGALGGRIGMLIWQPTPLLDLGAAKEAPPRFSWAFLSPARYLSGPVHLMRVLLGMVVVVIGVLWSKVIMNFIIDASGGTLTISTHLQDKLLLMEVSALATLAGAGLAGATTFNGLKQGLCVGIGSSIILVGFQLGSAHIILETIAFLIFSTMLLTLAGGWFGSQLFPPVFERPRRQAYDY